MAGRRIETYTKMAKTVEAVEEIVESDEFTILTEEDKREIEEEIRAEIKADELAKAKEEYKKKAKHNARVKKGLIEPQILTLIDLPGHASDIKLDGRPYYHGHQYTVPASVADTLLNVMDLAWRHEEATGGANTNAYRKPLHTSVSGVTNAVTHAPTHQPAISPMSEGRIQPKVNINTTQTLRG